MSNAAPRSVWIEIDVARWRRNYDLIRRALPHGVAFIAVVKDEAYGHGLHMAAQLALEAGARGLAVATVQEGVALREAGVTARIILFGDRQADELPWCVEHELACCLGGREHIARLAALAARAGKRLPVHLKINTGMNRYGAPWTEAAEVAAAIAEAGALRLEGTFSHFAQSDELDKTFALVQLARFEAALAGLAARGLAPGWRHLCNSGGFLDLPAAHFDAVRVGLLPLGVFPSAVCRRLPGIVPVMSVHARVAAMQTLQPGDHVGYGMRYTASSPRRLAVIPVGYGDGFPRVRNVGGVLLHGRRAPLIGGVAMDALTVDITDIPETRLGDSAVLMGADGGQEITVHDLAATKQSASYDILCGWRSRVPRVYRHAEAPSQP
jgi:alanine racemase